MEKTIDWFVLCEKPDQAKKIEKALGVINQRSSLLTGLISIKAARGRLFNFAKPEKQNEVRYGREGKKKPAVNGFSVANDKSYRSDFDRLKDMPVVLNSRQDGRILYEYNDNEAKGRGEALKKGLLQAKNIIIATDWDVAGELVFNDLVIYYELDNQLDWEKVYRVKLQGLDERSIQEAFADKVCYKDSVGSGLAEMQKMIAQGYARSIVDYEFGYTFSYYDEVVARQLNLQHQGGLGRLKLSILNAILDRQSAIEGQDLRDYYAILMHMGDLSVELDDIFYAKETAEGRIGQLPGMVSVELENAKRSVPAPLLFDRTSFIVEMDAKEPINWGRQLQYVYETKSSVSYPRTSSHKIHKRQFKRLLAILEDEAVQRLIKKRLKDRGYDDIAFTKKKMRPNYVARPEETLVHHAIIPTKALGSLEEKSLTSNGHKKAWQAYEEILMRTMAMFAENGVDRGQLIRLYDEEGSLFKEFLRQKTEKLGWRKLIDGPIYHDKLQDYSGEVMADYELVKRSVEPLKPYTHATLLSYLNQNRIGTDATREPIMNELVKIKMLSVNEKGEYSINPVVGQILRVIRTKGWLDNEKLKQWDAGLDELETMSEAVSFIEERREKLEEINKKVLAWYTTI